MFRSYVKCEITLKDIPSGKLSHSELENHHVQWVNPCKSTISMGHFQVRKLLIS